MLALYLPKVFGAALVLLVGVLLAQLANGLVRGAAEGVGLDYASGLGRIAQGLVIIISISVAISQLEVKTDLLNHVIVIVLITAGLAVALAMGLGSREIAARFLRESTCVSCTRLGNKCVLARSKARSKRSARLKPHC